MEATDRLAGGMDDDGEGAGDWVGVVLRVVTVTYAVGCLGVLAQGLLGAAAAVDPGVHEFLHVMGDGTDGFLARAARRAADGSHDIRGMGAVLLDYGASTFNLVLAGLLTWLRPRHRAAQLLVLALIGAAGVFNLTAQGMIESLPLTAIESVGQALAHFVAGLAYVMALLVFPDGRIVPRWRVQWLVLLYAPIAFGVVLLPLVSGGAARSFTIVAHFGVTVPIAGLVAQLYRVSHAESPTQQAQSRLLFWALLPAAVVAGALVFTNFTTPLPQALAGRPGGTLPLVPYRAFEAVFALVPIALIVGLIRHRLWDIERIANRAVVYALVTLGLGGTYVAFVLVVQLVLGQVGTSPLVSSKPAIALTTLFFATVFRSVRDRVQRLVDRRFNRARYDAARTVEDFSHRLRTAVEYDAIVEHLTEAVNATVSPCTVGIWLVPESQADDAGTRPEPASTTDGVPARAGVTLS